MAARRIWCFLAAVAASAVSLTCAGDSRDDERRAPEYAGGATSGASSGGGVQPDAAGTSSTGGAGTGGTSGGAQPDTAGTSTSGGAATAGTGGSQTGGLGVGNAGVSGIPSAGGGRAEVNASCDNVLPCGGDVLGSWTVIDSCLNVGGDVVLADFGLGCSAAPTTGSLEVTGSWSASAEGVVSDDTTTSGDATIDVPVECSESAALAIRCPALAAPIGLVLGYASLACVDSESAWCACSGSFEQTGGMGLISATPIRSGTYTTADGVLTVSDGTNRAEYFYCSSEDTLVLSVRSVLDTGAVTGTIVLQRQ